MCKIQSKSKTLNMVSCLILDLDQTLIHGYQSGRFTIIHKRPYMDDFIHGCFELVSYVGIWTMGNAIWAKTVIQLALERHLSEFFQIFHASHAMIYEGYPSKPLSEIESGPDSLLIDDQQINGLPNPERHLWIRPWWGAIDDCQLLYALIYVDHTRGRQIKDHRDWLNRISWF